MRYLYFLIVFFYFFTAKAQNSFLSKNYSEADSLSWTEELNGLDNVIDIIRFLDSCNEKELFLGGVPSGYPLKGEVEINSHYGMRKHPVTKTTKFHKGIDLKGTYNDEVYSTAEGKVEATGFDPNLGRYVIVSHPYGFQTIYGHLTKALVYRGKSVAKGDKIGLVGSTGTVTGPHLHYSIKKNAYNLDPFEFFYMK